MLFRQFLFSFLQFITVSLNCSLEKIRPEKELERAKSEILRCKLRLRDTFKHLDTLISEGKFDESLFDSEGEISSEDVCDLARPNQMYMFFSWSGGLILL